MVPSLIFARLECTRVEHWVGSFNCRFTLTRPDGLSDYLSIIRYSVGQRQMLLSIVVFELFEWLFDSENQCLFSPIRVTDTHTDTHTHTHAYIFIKYAYIHTTIHTHWLLYINTCNTYYFNTYSHIIYVCGVCVSVRVCVCVCERERERKDKNKSFKSFVKYRMKNMQ